MKKEQVKMKNRKVRASVLIPSSLFALSLSAAVPLSWTVETSRATPAQFEAYQGETLTFEAALTSRGKPLEAPLNYSFFWQTNGMGSTYWERKVVVDSRSCRNEGENSTLQLQLPTTTNNILRATWSPSMDVGAKVYNCFIGAPTNIYHAAFQLRLRPSPGATPNVLPLPTPVIDFAKVRVLNPPWPTKTVDGSARPLPKYLHEADFADSYPEEAAEYYRSRGDGKVDGGCSSVRDGGFLYRNFDFPFDDRAEFVVRMSSSTKRFASVGVAQVGTNITETMATSGKPLPPRFYKALPGATVDGINEHGVACNINVVDGDPQTSGWHTNATSEAVHPLAAIRWILDHATNAQHAATYIAANIRFPQGWQQNFHYMIADETSTYIVENGTAHKGEAASSPLVMTNFRLYPTRDTTGEGQERYIALTNGANITSQWWTLTYTASGYRASDLPGITGEDLTNLFNYWENNPRESHRGESFNGTNWWQSIHTSIYDLTNRVLRVAVQETDDWYTFLVPATGAKIDAYTKSETDVKLSGKLDTTGGDITGNVKVDGCVIAESLTTTRGTTTISDSKFEVGVDAEFHGEVKVGDSTVKSGAISFSNDRYGMTTYQDSLSFWGEEGMSNLKPDGSPVLTRDSANIPTTPQQVGAYPAASGQQLAGQVGTIGAHLNAEDARFVSTNYNSSTHMPEAYVEIKLPDQTWAVIWREMTRWNWFFDEWLPAHLYTKSQVDAMLAEKADRAWGYYDSHSGTYAPDGYTWISSPKVALAAGLGYQRTVTAEGAIWVLESNGLVTETGGVASNGFFRISDDEGNVQFEIVKGNKRTIGADASSCRVIGGFTPTKLQVGYSIISDAHPSLRICDDLLTQQWKDETDPDCIANVTWEGQSGAWVAYVQGKADYPLMFVSATYEVGGESYIRNVAPVSMDYLYIGGVKFAVGTATISGHTVLTLTPAP